MSGVEPDVARFLRGNIDSVEQLEILVLLRLQRERAFSPAELAREMRTSESSARTRLEGLAAKGLVRPTTGTNGEGVFQYAPADATLDAQVAAAATAYLIRRYAVIDVIFAKPTDKIRLFGEAFRLRKDRDDGDENG